MPDEQFARIISVRIRHPTEDRELEVNIDPAERVDAVFTSKDVIERLLFPFYERTPPENFDVGRFRRDLERQIKENAIICVPHQQHCKSAVAEITQEDLRSRFRFRGFGSR